jgi:hypothetical protein
MRWLNEPVARIGDVRQIQVFLWLPRRIGDETRWLERVWIRQVFEAGGWDTYWRDVCFLIG